MWLVSLPSPLLAQQQSVTSKITHRFSPNVETILSKKLQIHSGVQRPAQTIMDDRGKEMATLLGSNHRAMLTSTRVCYQEVFLHWEYILDLVLHSKCFHLSQIILNHQDNITQLWLQLGKHFDLLRWRGLYVFKETGGPFFTYILFFPKKTIPNS